LYWAILAGFRLIWAGIASIIHGFIPTLLDGKAPSTVNNIYQNHLVDHPNEK